LNLRFSGHRQGIDGAKEDSGCRILREHFNFGL
jgi:hypothetical protein